MKDWMYIIECSDGSYYTGSTCNLKPRIAQHQSGGGSNHTGKNLPVKLVYFGKFKRVQKLIYGKNKFKNGAEKRKRLG